MTNTCDISVAPDSISVKVRTEPSGAYELASSLTSQASTIDTASSDTRSAGSVVNSEMHGKAVSSAYQSLVRQGSQISTLRADMKSLASALNAFASDMASVKKRLLHARGEAVEAGLRVSRDTICRPTAARGNVNASDDDKAKMEKYKELVDEVGDIRWQETNAHEELQSKCKNISVDPGTQVANAYDTAYNAVSNTSDIVGMQAAVAWQAGGQFTAPSGTVFRPGLKPSLKGFWKDPRGVWKTAKESTDALKSAKNWTLKPDVAGRPLWKAAHTASKVVDKAGPAMKWAGRASSVLSGAVSAGDQYAADSRKHPSMGEGEKVARAGVKGASSAAGGFLGAKAGAEVGAVAGACIGGPVGAAVGGVAGGVIGGVAGSKAGEGVGNVFASGVSKLKKKFF